MARKKDITGKLIIGAVLGYVAIQAMSKPSGNRYQGGYYGNPNNQQYIPQEPPRNSPGWANWANAIIDIFGNAAELWQPGGPFHKGPTQEEIAAGWFADGATTWYP